MNPSSSSSCSSSSSSSNEPDKFRCRTGLSKLISNAVRLTHGFASNVRSRKARCLPTRIEISHLGYSISGGYIWPIANANARAQGSTGSRESLGALKHRRRQRETTGTTARKIFWMMRAARLSNARRVWTLRWPKDLPFWNEFKPAKKCWSVLWLCLLTKLVERFDPDQYRVREYASGVTQSFEDE